MRVAPPTITTPWTSLTPSPASRNALRTGRSVFCTSVCVMRRSLGVDRQVDELAGREPRGDRRLAVVGEVLFRLARLHEQQPHVAR